MINTNPSEHEFDYWYSKNVEGTVRRQIEDKFNAIIEDATRDKSDVAKVIVKGTYNLLFKDDMEKLKEEALKATREASIPKNFFLFSVYDVWYFDGSKDRVLGIFNNFYILDR